MNQEQLKAKQITELSEKELDEVTGGYIVITNGRGNPFVIIKDDLPREN